MIKPKISILSVLLLVLTTFALNAQLPVPDGRRLREIIAEKYTEGNLLIGGTTGSWALYQNTARLMNREFNYVTPENDFKQSQVHPDNSTFTWSKADPWVNHVLTNNQVLRIHGPVIPQCSDWAKNDARTPEELEKNMRDFMKALCIRYNGKTNFNYLDVVNETVINGAWHQNKPGTNWEMPWFIIGQDTDENQTPLYIKYAFELATQFAPDMKLVINQHETTIVNSTWNKIKKLVVYLSGWQAHILDEWEKIDGQQQALRDLIDWAHQNQLDFLITEQSVYLNANSSEKFMKQAHTYKAIMDIMVEKSKNGKILWNTWHIDDATGWKPEEFPSMFDSQYRPKPAYYGVQLALETKGDYTTPHLVKFKLRNTESDEPLENCEVVFNKQTKFTDKNGEVIYQASANLYNLEAQKRHFETKTIDLLSVYSDTVFNVSLDSADVFYNVNFVIEDSVTNEKISSAEITSAGHSGVTDLNGNVYFSIKPATYDFHFLKDNYLFYRNEFTIMSDTTFIVKLKRSHANVKFRIKNGTQPVNDALVVFGNDSLYTNSLGICNFNAFPVDSLILYSVEKEYFNKATGSIGFNTDTTVNIQLQKTVANIEFILLSTSKPALNAYVVLQNDTAFFDYSLKTRFYNIQKNRFHTYHVISDNFPVFTDSVYLTQDTIVTVQLALTGAGEPAVHETFGFYPNPAADKVMFHSNQINSILKILNLNGEHVKTIQFNQKQLLTDVSDLPAGLYIIHHYTNNGNALAGKKLVVKR